MSRIRVFVSHPSGDKALAGRFVRAIEEGMEINPCEIRCTSLTEYAPKLGLRVSTKLREEIENADVVVGLVTPKALKSSYVLFELGAAWGKGKLTFPLLAKGVHLNRLPELMKELNVENLSSTEGVERVIKDLAEALKVTLKQKDRKAYSEAVGWLVRVAKK